MFNTHSMKRPMSLPSAVVWSVTVGTLAVGSGGCSADASYEDVNVLTPETRLEPSRVTVGVNCHFTVQGCGGTWTGNPGGVDDNGSGYIFGERPHKPNQWRCVDACRNTRDACTDEAEICRQGWNDCMDNCVINYPND